MFRIGLDIGSVSVNVVLIDDKGHIVEDRYIRHKGKPIKAAKEVLEELRRIRRANRICGHDRGRSQDISPSSSAPHSPTRSSP